MVCSVKYFFYPTWFFLKILFAHESCSIYILTLFSILVDLRNFEVCEILKGGVPKFDVNLLNFTVENKVYEGKKTKNCRKINTKSTGSAS